MLVTLDPEAYPEADDIDSARLAEALKAIGPHELTYQHGTDRAQAAVTSGASDWAVLINPVTVGAIEDNTHSGKRMPRSLQHGRHGVVVFSRDQDRLHRHRPPA